TPISPTLDPGYNRKNAPAYPAAEARETHMAAFTLNGQRQEVGVDGDTPLLWVLREHLKLTGTKFGCGVAACGACTVHVDGNAIRSCITPLSLVEGRSVTTIEGLSPDGR